MKITSKITITFILLVVLAIAYSFTTLNKIVVNGISAIKHRALNINTLDSTQISKDEYIIYGTAKGIINGKKIMLFTQNADGPSLKLINTVIVTNEKFEIKGKVTEPSFHTLNFRVGTLENKIPFILENGEIIIAIDKDSVNKSKVSGTYNNDEYVKFNEDIIEIQKGLVDFQTKNMPLMSKAQDATDTTTISKLMKEFGEIQEKVSIKSKEKYTSYAETHPKSFVSILIIRSMLMLLSPYDDTKNIDKLYDNLDVSLKRTKPGKEIKLMLSKRE
jgi:hypothetical protein